MTEALAPCHLIQGRRRICLGNESHGRNSGIEGLAPRVTVGWLVFVVPVLVELEEGERLRETCAGERASQLKVWHGGR